MIFHFFIFSEFDETQSFLKLTKLRKNTENVGNKIVEMTVPNFSNSSFTYDGHNSHLCKLEVVQLIK